MDWFRPVSPWRPRPCVILGNPDGFRIGILAAYPVLIDDIHLYGGGLCRLILGSVFV